MLAGCCARGGGRTDFYTRFPALDERLGFVAEDRVASPKAGWMVHLLTCVRRPEELLRHRASAQLREDLGVK